MGLLSKLFGRSAVSREEDTGAVRLVRPQRQDAVLEVVGEGRYQPALLALTGGRTIEGPANRDHIATLVAEPTNPYDENAISVRVGGRLVGYLTREDGIRYQPVVRWAADKGRTIACEAFLIGGWDRGQHDHGSVGIVLHLGSPGETFLECLDEEVVVRTDHEWPGWLTVFTGESRYAFGGMPLDRESSEMIAHRAGLPTHPRLTKAVKLLVDCDPGVETAKDRKALEYGTVVVDEASFWQALGLNVELLDWRTRRGGSRR